MSSGLALFVGVIMADLVLSDVTGLTVREYESAKAAADKQISDLRVRPRRRDFVRESSSIWDLSDLFALLAFLAALLISSTHIVDHMARQTGGIVAPGAGLVLSSDLVVGIHQIAFIVLAESSVILFMVLGGAVRVPSSGARGGAVVQRVIFYALAVMSSVFVLVANVQSGIGILESVMPPAVTLGLGAYFERKLQITWARRRDVDQRYRLALDQYMASGVDVREHARYWPILRQLLADRINAKNSGLTIPLAVLQQAVARELLRDQMWERSDRGVLADVYRMVQDGTATPKKAARRRPAGVDQVARPVATITAPAPVLASGNGHGRPVGAVVNSNGESGVNGAGSRS